MLLTSIQQKFLLNTQFYVGLDYLQVLSPLKFNSTYYIKRQNVLNILNKVCKNGEIRKYIQNNFLYFYIFDYLVSIILAELFKIILDFLLIKSYINVKIFVIKCKIVQC